jgi:2-polyprenyl-3-methyl-5-hydroxy-6-metoxy-1,4-benzoquinol methylase
LYLTPVTWEYDGPSMSETLRINQQYYDQLYRQGNTFLRLLHSRVSFDQQAKLRPNRAALHPIFSGIASAKGRARVLDYGCGWGIFLSGLPKAQSEAYCYDIAEVAMTGLEDLMRMLGRRVNRISFGDDGRIIPCDFDIIICSHVLEHVDDDRSLLTSLVQALRPGGHLLINVPINEEIPDPKHVRSYDMETLRKLILSVGLKIKVERQVCKLSTIILQIERQQHITGRLLRVLWCLVPYRIILWIEKTFLKDVAWQQLIMVGMKND